MVVDKTIAIDIGNSVAKTALVDRSHLTVLARRALPTVDARLRLADAVADLVRAEHLAGDMPVVASSVVPSLRDILPGLLRGVHRGTIHLFSPHTQMPFAISYGQPQSLGTDRLAVALYCARRYPGASCVMIQAGTAVTVDYLAQGKTFAGGAILPGIVAQLAGLHSAAPALPKLDTSAISSKLPGATTEECIGAGVLYGLAGAVERLVEEYRRWGVDTVIATGGAWPAVASLVRPSHEYVPDAALVGTALYLDCTDVQTK